MTETKGEDRKFHYSNSPYKVKESLKIKISIMKTLRKFKEILISNISFYLDNYVGKELFEISFKCKYLKTSSAIN